MPPVYDVRARQPTPQQQRDEIGDCVIVERPQQRRAAAVLISEGRQAQVHALARIALRLPIQRLVLAVLSNRTMMPAESGATRTPIPVQGGQHSGDYGQQVIAA